MLLFLFFLGAAPLAETPQAIRVRSDIPNLKPLNFQNLTAFALLSTTNNYNLQNSTSVPTSTPMLSTSSSTTSTTVQIAAGPNMPLSQVSQHYLHKLAASMRNSPSQNWVSSSCDMYDSSSDTSILSESQTSIEVAGNGHAGGTPGNDNGNGNSARKHNREKEPIFGCLDCGKRYRSKTSLSLHKRLECGKEPAFQCPFCPLKTHQKGNLQVHIKKKHSDPRHFIGHQMS